jgi:hypothetical protein
MIFCHPHSFIYFTLGSTELKLVLFSHYIILALSLYTTADDVVLYLFYFPSLFLPCLLLMLLLLFVSSFFARRFATDTNPPEHHLTPSRINKNAQAHTHTLARSLSRSLAPSYTHTQTP